MALECLPVPSKTALASRRQMFVRERRGPPCPWHACGSVKAGESGCSDSSPSVLINFTASSMLIIDNLVGSRPSFLMATYKLLPAAQQLTPSHTHAHTHTPPSPPTKTKPISALPQTKRLMVPTHRSARDSSWDIWQRGSSQERTAWLT